MNHDDPTQRRLARVVALPPPAPGFLGPGHTAVEVLTPRDLADNDPFVLLMEDRLPGTSHRHPRWSCTRSAHRQRAETASTVASALPTPAFGC